ncbi:MAG: hypothetical protein KAX37_06300 [Opitutaceae bacterium]|jgi:hypothetical protein|nr:hypothetical protein [Opitutaceae bacterium]
MRLTFRFLALLAITVLLSQVRASAAEITALLVTASKAPGPSDPQLKPYEATLRRILRFESFRLVGEGNARLSAPGKGQIDLGSGHQLLLEVAGENSGRIDTTWRHGKRVLMRTGLSLRPGVPAVLGGPETGKRGEVYAVIVIAR